MTWAMPTQNPVILGMAWAGWAPLVVAFVLLVVEWRLERFVKRENNGGRISFVYKNPTEGFFRRNNKKQETAVVPKVLDDEEYV
jgi:hypothetical protein